jgi:hypothetical protein
MSNIKKITKKILSKASTNPSNLKKIGKKVYDKNAYTINNNNNNINGSLTPLKKM